MRFLGGVVALLLAAGSLSAQRTAVQTIILSPEPGERIGQEDVMVAASFVDRDGRLDPGTLALRVDGRDVTAEAEVSGEVVTWLPRQPLPPGPHRAELSARDRSGEPIEPAAWAFTVTALPSSPPAEEVRPGTSDGWSRFRGSVVFEGTGQSVSGPGAGLLRADDLAPRLWVNVGGLLGGGWRYSARVHVSGYESSAAQPVNRLRVDVRSDHLNAAVGDVNPVLHDLILAGTRVRGVEADLRAGPARLTVVRGATRRGIEGLVDPTDPTRVLLNGSYGQDLLAVRPALGGGAFQVGATFLRVQDDPGSIPELRVASGLADDSRRVNPLPKDNVVGGLDVTLRLLSGRVLLRYDNAISLLANDVSGGPLTEAQLDSILDAAGYDPLGIDPSRYADWFTINQSLIPLDPRGLTSLAQQARASFRSGSHILAVEWRSIGGAYYSLGYPSLVRDRRGVRVRDSFTALDDALALSAGFERDQDNLDDGKATTTTSSGVFATASWQPSPRSAALVASVRRGTRGNGLAAGETGARDETNVALSLGASVPIPLVEGFLTSAELNLSAVDRSDPANAAAESRDRYLLGGLRAETLDRSTEVSLHYGINRSELLGFDDARTDFHRGVLYARRRLLPTVAATLDGTFTAARSPQGAGDFGLAYDRLELLGGGEIELTPTSLVTVSAGVASYGDRFFPDRDTREFVTRIRVSRSF